MKEEAQGSKQGIELIRLGKRLNRARRETQTSRPPLLRGLQPPEPPSRFSLQARASPQQSAPGALGAAVLLADTTLKSPRGFNFNPHS